MAEVGREGGEGGAVREAARAVFESVGDTKRLLCNPMIAKVWTILHNIKRRTTNSRDHDSYIATLDGSRLGLVTAAAGSDVTKKVTRF